MRSNLESHHRFHIILVLLIFCVILSGFTGESFSSLAEYDIDDSNDATFTFTNTVTNTSTNTPEYSLTFTATNSEGTSTATPTGTSFQTQTGTYTLTPSQAFTINFQQTSTITSTPTPTLTPYPSVNIIGEYVPDELLVKISSSTSLSQITKSFDSNGAHVVLGDRNTELLKINVLLVKVPEGNIAEKIPLLMRIPGVIAVEPNYIVEMLETIPNDPSWPNQYGLVNIRAPFGWDYSTGSSAVTLAVLDTGIDLGNSEFSGKILPGIDFVNGDLDPQDDNGHGTHVSGIAAAIGNNGSSIAGTSWGVSLLPVKVLNSFGGGSYANVAAGIIWATDNNANVINMSFGGSGAPSDTVLLDAVNYAYDRGVVLVAASGNSGSGFVLYPARYDHVIGVAASDSANNRVGFSNFGPEIDVTAPGVSIISTSLGGGTSYRNGTSMAAPFVSGFASILAGYMGSNPDGIEFVMESTALDLGTPGYDIYTGYGLIQMDAGILLVLPSPQEESPTFTPTSTINAFGIPSSYFVTVTSTNIPTITFIPTALQTTESDVSINAAETPLSTETKLPSQSFTQESISEFTHQFIKDQKSEIYGLCCVWIIVILLLILVIKRDRQHE